MKLANMAGSLLALVITAPSAMAADAKLEMNMEKHMNQYMELKENKAMNQQMKGDMNGEQHRNRYQKHVETKSQYKDKFQNRLREKQDSGFRMNSGSGGKR
jgi:uncharacterized protein with beta-barrel porin domain